MPSSDRTDAGSDEGFVPTNLVEDSRGRIRETHASSDAPPRSYRHIEIADGVRTSARRTPNKVAVAERSRELTYAELVERIDRVANGVIAGLHINPGQHAAIMAPNCLEFIEVSLGLASAGVAPAMVNARSSPRELEFICNDAETKVLFVHQSLEEIARGADLAQRADIIVFGEAYERWLSDCRPTRPEVRIQEWDTFCIPYTSGTTGPPKGVLLPHRARTLTFFGMGTEFGCYTPDDRALATAPLFHGGGFAFAVAPLFFGGYCAIMAKFDPEELLNSVEKLCITNVFMVPTHFQAIFGLGEATRNQYRPTTLRTIISNAAPLAQSMKEQIIDYVGEGILFETYGSTEAGIVTVLRPRDQLRKQQSVGLPFPCTDVRLVSDDGKSTPVGEVGELYCRSPYLFNGYWNRPKETADAFQGGWFSAGDLARQDEEGYVYLVDRKDDKIVTGGLNVYPREIEEVLARHPAVAEVSVYGVPDEYWGEAIHATVALRPGNDVTPGGLIEFCSEQLARYKLPKAIDFKESLPKSAAGKILRRELREPFWAGRERQIS